MTDKLNLNLFENAINSLYTGLEHYDKALAGDKSQYKDCALHFSLYIELSMKYFVQQIDPKGIYYEDNREKTRKHHEIMDRLKKEGNKFCSSEERNIDYLRNTANAIKHHTAVIDLKVFQNKVDKVLTILDEMYFERDIIVTDKLDNGLIIKENCDFYNLILDNDSYPVYLSELKAKEIAKLSLPRRKTKWAGLDEQEVITECPSCLENTCVLEEYSVYTCKYCKKTFNAVSCGWCYKIFLPDRAYRKIEEPLWCSEQCWNNTINRH